MGRALERAAEQGSRLSKRRSLLREQPRDNDTGRDAVCGAEASIDAVELELRQLGARRIRPASIDQVALT